MCLYSYYFKDFFSKLLFLRELRKGILEEYSRIYCSFCIEIRNAILILRSLNCITKPTNKLTKTFPQCNHMCIYFIAYYFFDLICPPTPQSFPINLLAMLCASVSVSVFRLVLVICLQVLFLNNFL